MGHFTQQPPVLGNQYLDDDVLRRYLRRLLPKKMLQKVEPLMEKMGDLAGGSLYEMQQADRLNEPRLTQWDSWGNRVDEIELTPLWQEAEKIAVEFGLTAIPYEAKYGRFSRPIQFALAYLFHPSSDFFNCPLAMTDGAARTLQQSGNRALIKEYLPHLISRDPEQFWTSGQWMTETVGGSDVSQTQTVARQDEEGVWRLYGRKWFTSATTAQIALVLARPEGAAEGDSQALALFLVKLRDEEGRLQNIEINRLKDKLGTRKVPTAELELMGTPAYPVGALSNGVQQIVPMLHVTRAWNSISAAAMMRRGTTLAVDYAQKRHAFSTPLSEKPLHIDTLADMQCETAAAFHLSFRLAELISLVEEEEARESEIYLMRMVTSLVKMTTGRQVVAVISEALEAHGGAGYVEDTGLPLLMRDSQVLPIWEGTTNVLALDTLRSLTSGDVMVAYRMEIARCLGDVSDPALSWAKTKLQTTVDKAVRWLVEASVAGQDNLKAGARRFTLTLGRCYALALMLEQAQWSLTNENDPQPRALACRFAKSKIDLLQSYDLDEARLAAGL